MDNRKELIAHLENLHKAGKKQATLDIAMLLSALKQGPAAQASKVPQPITRRVNIDGGSF